MSFLSSSITRRQRAVQQLFSLSNRTFAAQFKKRVVQTLVNPLSASEKATASSLPAIQICEE